MSCSPGLPLQYAGGGVGCNLQVGMSGHSIAHECRTALARELSAWKPSLGGGFE